MKRMMEMVNKAKFSVVLNHKDYSVKWSVDNGQPILMAPKIMLSFLVSKYDCLIRLSSDSDIKYISNLLSSYEDMVYDFNFDSRSEETIIMEAENRLSDKSYSIIDRIINYADTDKPMYIDIDEEGRHIMTGVYEGNIYSSDDNTIMLTRELKKEVYSIKSRYSRYMLLDYLKKDDDYKEKGKIEQVFIKSWPSKSIPLIVNNYISYEYIKDIYGDILEEVSISVMIGRNDNWYGDLSNIIGNYHNRRSTSEGKIVQVFKNNVIGLLLTYGKVSIGDSVGFVYDNRCAIEYMERDNSPIKMQEKKDINIGIKTNKKINCKEGDIIYFWDN